jgi:hypothetical protein
MCLEPFLLSSACSLFLDGCSVPSLMILAVARIAGAFGLAYRRLSFVRCSTLGSQKLVEENNKGISFTLEGIISVFSC